MIGILRDQHMSEQPGPCKSAIDRPRGCWCLHDAVAGLAAQLRTHMANNLEAGPHVLQHLGGICAQLAHVATAIGAGIVLRHVRVDFTRKMLG